jgi:hypothetical protein
MGLSYADVTTPNSPRGFHVWSYVGWLKMVVKKTQIILQIFLFRLPPISAYSGVNFAPAYLRHGLEKPWDNFKVFKWSPT